VGLAGFEGYNHQEFYKACMSFPQLIPVAGMDINVEEYKAELDEISNLGFAGIKIHPRISNLNYSNNRITEIIQYCAQKKLVVLYCTYAHSRANRYPKHDPFYSLIEFIADCQDTQIILMHGGDVNLLKYAELVRFNPNLMLDLSMTIMKYRGSSIDQDIEFLFQKFDRRICIGTDHPEYSHADLRTHFESLCLKLNLNQEKIDNIAWQNLSKLFNVK
jgi:predicted TIM-barrel fold metal-dependent hydrolase